MITAIELVQQVCRDVVGVQVVSKVPRIRPALFVRVDQAAPVRINPAQDRVTVMVQVYGEDLEKVITTCQTLREHLIDVSAHHAKAYGWDEVQGPVEFPDPDIPEFRWQFSGTLFMAP